jgi:hypothetical protein
MQSSACRFRFFRRCPRRGLGHFVWLLVFVIGAAVGSKASFGTNFETALTAPSGKGRLQAGATGEACGGERRRLPVYPESFGKVIAAAPTNPRTSSPLPTSSMMRPGGDQLRHFDPVPLAFGTHLVVLRSAVIWRACHRGATAEEMPAALQLFRRLDAFVPKVHQGSA